MTITPVVFTSGRETKSGLYPIKIRITEMINGKPKTNYEKIGKSIPLDHWDSKTNRVNHKNPLMQDINFKINEVLLKLNKNALNGVPVLSGDREDFYWWYEEFLKTYKKNNSTFTYKSQENPLIRLKKFREKLKVSQFDLKFLMEFKAQMGADGCGENYIKDVFKRIGSVVKIIVNSGALEYHKNPLLTFKIKTKNTERPRLPIDEIKKFEIGELKGVQKIARDWYIISFYLGGIRFGDVFRLRENNFIDGRLIFKMNKTGGLINKPIPEKIIPLLKEYNYRYPSNVLLVSEFTETFSSKKAEDIKIKKDIIDKQIKNTGQLYRKALKRACKTLGIQPINPHTVRHSLADFGIEQGLTPPEIQGQLGHKDLDTTVAYLKLINQKVTDAGSQKLWGLIA